MRATIRSMRPPPGWRRQSAPRLGVEVRDVVRPVQHGHGLAVGGEDLAGVLQGAPADDGAGRGNRGHASRRRQQPKELPAYRQSGSTGQVRGTACEVSARQTRCFTPACFAASTAAVPAPRGPRFHHHERALLRYELHNALPAQRALLPLALVVKVLPEEFVSAEDSMKVRLSLVTGRETPSLRTTSWSPERHRSSPRTPSAESKDRQSRH